jgi:flagellar basal-body rod protein FlgB
MDLTKIPVFGAITKRMNWLQQRQRVLAQNIANANTPGYRPRDLKELDFKDVLRRSSGMKMTATNPQHIAAKSPSQLERFGTRMQKDTYEASPDGNAVVLEEQMLKVTENRMDYELMTNLYRKHINMLRTAMGRGR